jgi:pimeloyl-ACP methyl ester carboxylesterase
LRGLFNSIAYNGFSKYLEIKGYNSSKFWGTSTMKNYVTLWDPRDPDIGYSSLSYATPGNLDADFTRIYDLVKQYSYANKFNTIGHSTGGLAARYWAVKFGDKMNKIITVGTPHAGITEFYNEAFGGRYTSRADFIKKSLVLPDGSTANLIQWFVPEWDAVDESSIPDFPPEQTKSPYFSNTFNYGYNPAVKFYILYGSWNDPKWKENNKPAPWLSTPYSTKITWLNKNQIWYKISRMLYAEGDGYVFSGSASAGINGPANGPNFIRKGFDISYPHGVILNNPEIRTYISQNLMAS